MTNVTEKPTTQDAFESIYYGYHYPFTNMTDNTVQWMPSQDIQNGLILQCIELEEQFVESVATLKTLPFTFEKSLQGTVIKKSNRLGHIFYDLLRLQNKILVINSHFLFPTAFKIRNIAPPKYEVSEKSKILYSVASKLHLNQVTFTGDPTKPLINSTGLLEGEFINSFVESLRKEIKRKDLKSKVAERKKESAQGFTQTKRHITSLYANNTFLEGVRMVICDHFSSETPVTLKKSNAHLMKFFEPFITGSWVNSPVGWWWKREYMTEVGYHYYLILFFNRQTYPLTLSFTDAYRQHWHSVTQGQGVSFIPSVPNRDYERGKNRFDNMQVILSSIECMFMRDNYLRLERNPKSDHYGMGTVPKWVALGFTQPL